MHFRDFQRHLIQQIKKKTLTGSEKKENSYNSYKKFIYKQNLYHIDFWDIIEDI